MVSGNWLHTFRVYARKDYFPQHTHTCSHCYNLRLRVWLCNYQPMALLSWVFQLQTKAERHRTNNRVSISEKVEGYNGSRCFASDPFLPAVWFFRSVSGCSERRPRAEQRHLTKALQVNCLSLINFFVTAGIQGMHSQHGNHAGAKNVQPFIPQQMYGQFMSWKKVFWNWIVLEFSRACE